MHFSEMIRKVYLGNLPEEAFIENCAAITDTNFKFAKSFAWFAALVFLFFTLVSGFIFCLANSFWVYFATLIAMCAALLFIHFYVNGHKSCSAALIYAIAGMIAAATILLGTFFQTNGYAAAFIGVIAVLPSQILDKPGRVALISAAATLAFCVCALITKDGEIALMDCVNAVSMYFVGAGMAYYNIKTRMSSIIGKAQVEWNESRYRAILRESEDIIIELDPVARTCYLSDRSDRFFDECVTYETLIKADMVFPDDREQYGRMLRMLLEKGENAEGEIRFIARDGSVVWFSVHIITLMGPDGSRKRVVGRLTNIDAQKLKEELLDLKSQTDAMTGLLNKAATEAHIVSTLENGERNCILLLSDMDNLKTVNDSLGHAEGDVAIKNFASILKKHFRSTDIIGRAGGDEFMIFLSGVEDQLKLSDTLRLLIEELNGIRIGGKEYWRLGVSIGAAARTPRNEDFQSLYRMADAALYRVKKDLKNGFAFYDPSIDKPMS